MDQFIEIAFIAISSQLAWLILINRTAKSQQATLALLPFKHNVIATAFDRYKSLTKLYSVLEHYRKTSELCTHRLDKICDHIMSLHYPNDLDADYNVMIHASTEDVTAAVNDIKYIFDTFVTKQQNYFNDKLDCVELDSYLDTLNYAIAKMTPYVAVLNDKDKMADFYSIGL